LAEHFAAEILDRHPGGFQRIFAAVIGIDAGLIVQNADLTPCADAGAASNTAPTATAANNPDFMFSCLPAQFIARMIFNNPRLPIYFA